MKDAEKQKQNLLNSPNQINLNKMSLNEDVELTTTTNGHKQNSGDESDEDIQTATATEPISTDENKPQDPNEPDSINRRKLFY